MTARVDYERHGRSYATHRRADPRIAARIHAALGDAHTVLNVGAGTGSYEPSDRWVLAVEPSATMRAQRPAAAAPAIDARAEALPFDDDSFDAAMACVTIHHWEPPEAGLAELRRVVPRARGCVHVRARRSASMAAGVSTRGRGEGATTIPRDRQRGGGPRRANARRASSYSGRLYRWVLRGVLEAPRGTVGSRCTQRSIRLGAARSGR